MIHINDYLENIIQNEDEKRFVARINDLCKKAAYGNAVFSDFLDLRQQALARSAAVNESSVNWRFEGGYTEAERKRLVVYPGWETKSDAYIACLRICHHEFKDITIGHRDYLGAVLNLGIKREKLGDIVVEQSNACLFADEGLTDYIVQQLRRVKHSNVWVEQVPLDQFVYQTADIKTIHVSMASLRLDAAVAAVFNLSRTQAEQIIEAGNVKVNHMDILKCAAPVKTGDLISVRGQGRFRLESITGISRKGRYQLEISCW